MEDDQQVDPQVDTEAPETPPEGEPEQTTEAVETPEEGGAPAPESVTREMLEEALSGVSGQYQQHIDNLGQQLRQMQQALMARKPQPQPQQKQSIVPDDVDAFSNMDGYKVHQMLKTLEQRTMQNEQKMQQRYNEIRQQNEMRERSERYYQHLYNQTEAAAKSDPMFQDQEAREFLERQVVAHVQASNGNIQQVNIPQIAQKTAAFIRKLADAKYKEKLSAPPAKPQAPKGSPAKPGKPPLDVKSLDDLDKAMDQVVPGFEKQLRQEMGLEYEE